MSKLGTVRFSGKSGARHAFAAYPLETVFARGVSGVYVVTRRKPGKSKKGFVHKGICTGQSDDLRQSLASDERSFSARGANCICVHTEKDKGARQKIEQDLVREPRTGSP
ncbi:MAG TPA: hypothetical protein VNA25_27785 [Phycisphaerae bacterium]|nr:hypothetical protein [Phycisphaerae bacterium]